MKKPVFFTSGQDCTRSCNNVFKGLKGLTIQVEQMLTVGNIAVCLEVSRLGHSQQHCFQADVLSLETGTELGLASLGWA